MSAYYNEIDPFAAAWLRELIKAGHIAAGDVDERDIREVRADELVGYSQCHFFAGIGGWSYALRLAGWSDNRPVWTGSCPCQSFSAAGKGAGFADPRHLWPEWFRLIRESRPECIFGEQVEAAVRHGWLDLVSADLEAAGYACGATVLGAHSVGAPHVRQRLYFVADSTGTGRERLFRGTAPQISQDRSPKTLDAWHGTGNPFEQWKKLLAGTCIRRMAHGTSSTMDVRPSLRGYGNAIVPQAAQAFIKSYMEVLG